MHLYYLLEESVNCINMTVTKIVLTDKPQGSSFQNSNREAWYELNEGTVLKSNGRMSQFY